MYFDKDELRVEHDKLERIEHELFDLCNFYLEHENVEEFTKVMRIRRKVSDCIDRFWKKQGL